MNGLWDQPGVPHKGWRCIACNDLEEPIGQCEMCGKEAIRYVHTMEHDEYHETLDVGCICAEKMEDSANRPRRREQRMKNKSRRRANWLRRKWRVSEKGNEFINVEQHNVVVYRSRQFGHANRWRYRIEDAYGASSFSKASFATSDDAKLAAFEEFWARISDD
jgi:hypothetical protein